MRVGPFVRVSVPNPPRNEKKTHMHELLDVRRELGQVRRAHRAQVLLFASCMYVFTGCVSDGNKEAIESGRDRRAESHSSERTMPCFCASASSACLIPSSRSGCVRVACDRGGGRGYECISAHGGDRPTYPESVDAPTPWMQDHAGGHPTEPRIQPSTAPRALPPPPPTAGPSSSGSSGKESGTDSRAITQLN